MADKWGNLPSIHELVPLDEIAPPVHKPEELYGVDLLFVDFEVRDGQIARPDGTKGSFALFTVKTDPEGDDILVSCGGWQVMAVVQAIQTGEIPMPFVGQFAQSGRSKFIVGAGGKR